MVATFGRNVACYTRSHDAQSVSWLSQSSDQWLRLYIDSRLVLTLHRQVSAPHSTKMLQRIPSMDHIVSACEIWPMLAGDKQQYSSDNLPGIVMPLCLIEHLACLSCFTPGMMLFSTTFPTAISTRSGRQTPHKERRVPKVGFLARIRLINRPETPNFPF